MSKTRLCLSLWTAISILSLFFVVPGYAAPFQNGSFEIAAPACVPGFVGLGNGSTVITGWTVGGNSVDLICGGWNSADGAQSLDLDGGAPGAISQTFDTNPGERYLVRFALAGNPACGNPVKNLRVTISGLPINNDFQTDTTGVVIPNLNWSEQSFSFTATGPSHTITFTSLDIDSACGPALDNVRISLIASPVPTMNEWGMIILALSLGLGAVYGLRSRLSRS